MQHTNKSMIRAQPGAGLHAMARRSGAPRRPLARASASPQQPSSPPKTAQQTESASAVAGLMRAAVEFALRVRLKDCESVEAEVDCDLRDVLDGRFRSLAIRGAGWHTPLGMTARFLEVDISTIQVDYGTLVFQQKVALKGPPPRGRTTITLNAADLGAFTQHPLFRRAAATAVQGQSFDYDPSTVAIDHAAPGGGGVLMEGVWAGDGERYQILMQPGSGGSSSGRRQASDPPQQQRRRQQQEEEEGDGEERPQRNEKSRLRVGARHLPRGGGGGGDAKRAAVVAAGIAEFFTGLAIDLDGIEISRPVLSLQPWSSSSSSSSSGGGSSGGDSSDAGDAGDAGDESTLAISMAVRMRKFPAIDMQF